MATETQSNLPVTITLTPQSYAGIEAEAQRLGLSVSAYVLGIHGVQTGKISRQTLETIGKIFSRDDEILRELAK